ncbi:hypothetical protein CEXT_1851 [Caerostris extrusa]|uniref:Uncharacterized protein n=1 Tax=Caerostris extrusa TaxID=172846 RepID=A0AAV4RZ98_CAEEX|nr:hypothetical protein CEXT_1851 [Caerostris extrusa]
MSFCLFCVAGEDNLLDMATVYPPNESTGKENHAQAPLHELQDEGARTEGAVLPKPAGQCPGHGRRLPPAEQHFRGVGYVHTVSGGRAAGGREGVGGRDSPLPPVPQHAEGAAEHPAGAALHHQENAGRGREPGGHLRLEVRGHGRRPHMPVRLHSLHHPVHLRHHLLSTPPRGVRSDFS